MLCLWMLYVHEWGKRTKQMSEQEHVDPLTPSCWEVIYAAGCGGRETCTPPDGDSSPPPLEPSLQLLPPLSHSTPALDICVRTCPCARMTPRACTRGRGYYVYLCFCVPIQSPPFFPSIRHETQRGQLLAAHLKCPSRLSSR